MRLSCHQMPDCTCSISKLFTAEQNETETESFLPASLANEWLPQCCLFGSVPCMPGLWTPHALPGTTPLHTTMFVPVLMYAFLTSFVFLMIQILCTHFIIFNFHTVFRTSWFDFSSQFPNVPRCLLGLFLQLHPSRRFGSEDFLWRNKLAHNFFSFICQR